MATPAERKLGKKTKGYDVPPTEMIKAGKEIETAKDTEAPRNRAASALQLRIDGAGWGDIARVLDFDTPAEGVPFTQPVFERWPTSPGPPRTSIRSASWRPAGWNASCPP